MILLFARTSLLLHISRVSNYFPSFRHWPELEDDVELLKPATTFSRINNKGEVSTMAGNKEIEILREVEIVPDEDNKEHVKR